MMYHIMEEASGAIVEHCDDLNESNEADRIALDLAANMHKYGFKYDHIVIEED